MADLADQPNREASGEAAAQCPRCGTRNPAGFKFCGNCGSPLAPAPDRRRLATLLFCDLVGSTAIADRLDPEAVRQLNLAYFAAARDAVERHGGTVEKFIGDAVMAVFGAVEVHEDDAVRAVRAALEIRDAVRALSSEAQVSHGISMQTRIGLNTGEVVTGDASLHQAMVSGDAVNVAARLEQAAPPDGILLGALTRQLTRGELATRSLGQLMVKGKPLGVAAWEVIGRRSRGGPPGGLGALVGREGELGAIRAAFDACVLRRQAQVFTIMGEPGIGKSTLGAASARGLDCDFAYARCPPYGEDISYAPLRDIVRGVLGIDVGGSAPPDHLIAEALAGTPDRERAVRVLSALFATDGETAAVEDVAWAVRSLLRRHAERRPIMVLLDDLQWSAPSLVEMLLGWVRGLHAPVLIMALARPELAELRPRWHVDLLLQPLSKVAAEQVARQAARVELDEEALARLTTTARGNPLFLKELAAVMADARSEQQPSSGDMPASLTAVLSARLDRLPDAARSVIDVASVQGESFAVSWVAQALNRAAEDLLPILELLQDRGMVRHDPMPADDWRAFGHILLRDVAYAALPMRRRAELHRALAAWVSAIVGPDTDELSGYHHEQAFLAGSAVHGVSDRVLADAAASASSLNAAGRRALDRSDFPAAASLLSRALRMATAAGLDTLSLQDELASAEFEAGEPERALATLDELVRMAGRDGDERMRIHGLLDRSDVRFYAHPDDPSLSLGSLERVAADGLSVFAAVSDQRGMAKCWMALANLDWAGCCFGRCGVRAARALRYSLRAGDLLLQRRIKATLAMANIYGPTPLARAIPRVDRLLERSRDDRGSYAHLLAFRALARCMAGEIDAARADHQAALAELSELGSRFQFAEMLPSAAEIEIRAGNILGAAALLEEACSALRAVGGENLLATSGSVLAGVLCLAGRCDDAIPWAEEARSLTAETDVDAQVRWRVAEALIALHREDPQEAWRLAEEAHKRAEATDVYPLRLEVAMLSARVAAARGRAGTAAGFLREARRLAAEKGAVADVGRTDELSRQLRATPTGDA